jgi:hypothetical protein
MGGVLKGMGFQIKRGGGGFLILQSECCQFIGSYEDLLQDLDLLFKDGLEFSLLLCYCNLLEVKISQFHFFSILRIW